MSTTSTNPFDLLGNEDLHSKRPQEKQGPGKPDKSEQRRSVPKEPRRGPAGGDAGQEQQRRNRVEDREHTGRGGRGGRGSRGGRGGRGGYHGLESDGVRRNFDRKQGEHHRNAPGAPRKNGAVGEVDPSNFAGASVEQFAEADAAAVTEANGDVVGEDILDITPMPVDPDEGKLTYDEYIAQKQKPEDDVNRQVREVTNDGDFRPARQLKKEEDSLFGDVQANKAGEGKQGEKKNKKKATISLDEFVGERPTASSAPAESSRGGRGGTRGGFSERGGRGGFGGEQRGGRGGFGGEQRGGRGGRGGFAPRGGRGGQRGGAAAAPNVGDQSAFPALSPKA